MAASFSRFSSMAPENPTVDFARELRSTSSAKGLFLNEKLVFFFWSLHQEARSHLPVKTSGTKQGFIKGI